MRTSWWINRTLCDVLEDMRRCQKTHNYAALEALIEEAQIMGNKMEAAIGDKNDIQEMQETRSELKKQIKKLKKKRKKLEE